MNRWWGNRDDSEKQASERNSRAARRTIAGLQVPLVLSSDDDELDFNDCETSLHLPNVDGTDDTDLNPGPGSSRQSVPTPTPAMALPFDRLDAENDAEAWKKEVKTKFNSGDVLYWFNTVEAEMKKHGINRQWDKKSSIVPLLPQEIVEELMPLLRLTEEEASKEIYYEVKQEILLLYGPKEEDAYKKAKALKCTGRPSAFGKQLLHLICPGTKPFESCHCARIVFGMWEEQLSAPIKSHLAGLTFNKDTYKNIFKKADEVWLANGGAVRPPAVVAAVAQPSSASSEQADVPQVAAVRGGGRGRGRGNRGNRGGRGGGRGGQSGQSYNNQNQSQDQTPPNAKPHQRGPKHPDLPASAGWACAQHWKKGRQAPYCSDPLVCQWVRQVVARTPTNAQSNN